MKDQIRNLFSSLQHFHKAEIYLLITLLVFGLFACFLLPVSGGYDEETHLMRVWEMSALEFIPNDVLGKDLPFPAVYWEMSYRRDVIVRAVEPGFWEKFSGLSLDALDYVYQGVETRSVYSPPLLLPQAFVMRYLGRSLQWPALTVFYILRVTGLLSFLFLVWLSVRIIPFGKWILAILATSPVAILQAATISADAISNGIAFLFIAGTLAIVQKSEIRKKEWGLLAFLFLILFWGKINIAPLAALPFLILRPSQFKSRYAYMALFALAISLFLLEEIGWSAVAYSRLTTAPENTDPVGQIGFILAHPIEFISLLSRHILFSSFENLQDWIAIYGFAYWPVPTLTYYLFVLAVVASLFVTNNDSQPDQRTRWGLFITFVLAYLATIISLYITFTPVGQGGINGVQGRYFTTVMPLLFLALVCLPLFQRIQAPAIAPALLGVFCLLFYIAGMYLSYHVPCGSQFYRTDLCHQPNYKNWAPDDQYSPPVGENLILKQEIIPECNGMTELRLWINAENADPNGMTLFTFRDMNQDSDVLQISVPNSELPVKEWYSLTFPPDWASNGKFYLLTVEGNQQNNQGIRIAYSLRPEYPSGKLYENEQPISRDLIFQTGCIAGWNKIRLTGSP